MYKTKLQELCHQRSWRLPEYSITKEGPDHNPSFLASVSVNGELFNSQFLARSSKVAQNDAAELAWLHFSSSAPLPPSHPAPSHPAPTPSAGKTKPLNAPERHPTNSNEAVSVATNEDIFMGKTKPLNAPERHPTNSNEVLPAATNEDIVMGKTKPLNAPERHPTNSNEVLPVAKSDDILMGKTKPLNAPERHPTNSNEVLPVAKNDDILMDMPTLLKNQLQQYAQRRNLPLPVYSCERVGPSHAARFRCKVTIEGKTYESQEFYSNLNKAELAVAKIALMSLLPDGLEQDESSVKNLLQELAQRKGYCLPTYVTNKYGQPHHPTFISTVEVNENTFTGKEAKTKKQAEASAAKVAYTALRLCNSNQSSALLLPKVAQSSSLSMQPNITGKSGQSSLTVSPESSQSSSRMQPDISDCQGQIAAQLSSHGKRSVLAGNSSTSTSPAPKRQEIQHSASSLRADLVAHLQQTVQFVQPKLPVDNELAEVDSGLESNPGSRTVSSPALSISSSNSSSSLPLLLDSSTTSSICSNIEQLILKSTASYSNVIIVHPREAAIAYPAGGTVLPLSDDNWVAVEFAPQSSQ